MFNFLEHSCSGGEQSYSEFIELNISAWLITADHKDKSSGGSMEILYILVPSVAIPLAIALLFFFICVCRNNQKSSRPPAPRQPKPVRGQNVEMSMLTTAYKPKVGLCSSTLSGGSRWFCLTWTRQCLDWMPSSQQDRLDFK